jgi:hypothetical protein
MSADAYLKAILNREAVNTSATSPGSSKRVIRQRNGEPKRYRH